MKYGLIFFLMWSTLLCDAQNIPNGTFDQWEVREHLKLDAWYSPTANVQQTTDTKISAYALKLLNTPSTTGNGTKGYIRNVDYNRRDTLNGFAFNGDPLSMVFWSKHDLAPGDTARAYVVFKEKGSTKGTVDFRFTGSTNGEFVKYSVPIVWTGLRTPDTAWVYLYSCYDTKVDDTGFAIIDDFHFEKIGERMPELVNGDFALWSNKGVSFPLHWRSIDLRQYDTYQSFLPEESVTQVTGVEAFLGGTSLRIQNYSSSGKPTAGYCYVGTENNDYYTPTFPILDTFKYLQGYYKYLPDGDDTARINFRAWQEGKSRINENLYLDKSEEWTFFKIKLNYDAAKYAPDSAALMIWATNTKTVYGAQTKLYLDNLELVTQLAPLQLNIPHINAELKIGPNPVRDYITIQSNLQIHHIVAMDALGRQADLPLLNQRADMRHLNPGVYYLKIYLTPSYFQTYKVLKSE